MTKVLVIEDDDLLAKVVAQTLCRENYLVETVNTGDDGMDRLRFYKFDVVIMDVNLPGMSGFDICRQVRSLGQLTPILMLTGRDSIIDREHGLDVGADDYLCKPFDMRELLARVRALIRRASQSASHALTAGDLELDPQRFTVKKSGKEIFLSKSDFSLLEFLMRHPGQTLSPEAILDQVYASDSENTVAAVRSSIKRIRKVIDSADRASIISTIYGVGYRLQFDATE